MFDRKRQAVQLSAAPSSSLPHKKNPTKIKIKIIFFSTLKNKNFVSTL